MLTIIYDNQAGEPEFGAAWGFGCVVTGYERTVLFDTGGSGELLMENLARADIAPEAVDAVVISHNHWDHAGGLDRFLTRNPAVVLYPPGPVSRARRAKIEDAGGRVEYTRKSSQVCYGVWTTPLLGGLLKEQALCLSTEAGLVIITGCAHPGLLRIVAAAAEVTGQTPSAIVGGFHLKDATEDQIARVTKGLKDSGVSRAGPCHCTGDRGRQMMSEAFGQDFVNVGVGRCLTIRDLTT